MARNVDVDRHLHRCFEVSRFDVDDFMSQIVLCGMCHLVAKRLHLADGRMSLEIVYAEALSKTLDNEAGFETIY